MSKNLKLLFFWGGVQPPGGMHGSMITSNNNGLQFIQKHCVKTLISTSQTFNYIIFKNICFHF